jgi:hypothetical protein
MKADQEVSRLKQELESAQKERDELQDRKCPLCKVNAPDYCEACFHDTNDAFKAERDESLEKVRELELTLQDFGSLPAQLQVATQKVERMRLALIAADSILGSGGSKGRPMDLVSAKSWV